MAENRKLKGFKKHKKKRQELTFKILKAARELQKKVPDASEVFRPFNFGEKRGQAY